MYACAMSVMAAGHALVAVGTAGTAVRLIDPLSGAVTHSLAGHTAGVMALAWSPRDQHTLLTGGGDGAVRVSTLTFVLTLSTGAGVGRSQGRSC